MVWVCEWYGTRAAERFGLFFLLQSAGGRGGDWGVMCRFLERLLFTLVLRVRENDGDGNDRKEMDTEYPPADRNDGRRNVNSEAEIFDMIRSKGR